MKKVLALLLALVMVLSLAACGSTEEKTEEPQQEEAPQTETQTEETETIETDIGESAYHSFDEKAMTRAGIAGDLDFSNLPATEDKAEYLSDGRLQLTSSDLNLVFDIPFGWLVITQDGINQQEDYAMITDDPAYLVSGMQEYRYNAIVLSPSDEQMMVRVVKDDISTLVLDLNNFSEHDLSILADVLQQNIPELGDLQFTVLGDRTYMLMDFTSQGYVIIGTVVNSMSVYYFLELTETLTEDAVNEFAEFIAQVEYK